MLIVANPGELDNAVSDIVRMHSKFIFCARLPVSRYLSVGGKATGLFL